MRTPREIYEAYSIMPNLQEHQLRVAAVCKTVCDRFQGSVDTEAVMLAALFHDMGNILKFDLAYFQEFIAERGLVYWSGVQKEYEAKYGKDHHAASVAIARELGMPERVVLLISRVTFRNLKEIRDDKAYEQKVVNYADLRVGPHGVLSLQGRLDEAHGRYQATRPHDTIASDEYEMLIAAAHDIESQLFAHCEVAPADITDASIAPTVEELWKYPVP